MKRVARTQAPQGKSNDNGIVKAGPIGNPGEKALQKLGARKKKRKPSPPQKPSCLLVPQFFHEIPRSAHDFIWILLLFCLWFGELIHGPMENFARGGALP